MKKFLFWLLAFTGKVLSHSTREGDVSYQEYLAAIYAYSEDWFAFANNWEAARKIDKSQAERILKTLPNDQIRSKIERKMVRAFQKPGGLGSVLSLGRQQWPNASSESAQMYEDARILLECKQWIPLIDKLIEISKTADYQRNDILKKMVVSGGLAIIDNSEIFPSCLAPWPKDSKISLGLRASYIITILRLRRGDIDITEPKAACKAIKVSDLAQCVRILTNGGYKRADELFGQIRNEDERIAIGLCFTLEHRGPRAAFKYFAKRPAPKDPRLMEFISGLGPTLQALDPWNRASKELSNFCPNPEIELSIHRRIIRTELNTEVVKQKIKNLEKIFWVLLAAQNKEAAKEQLESLEKELQPILAVVNIRTKKKSQIELTLMEMKRKLELTESVDLQHVKDYQKQADQVVKALLQENYIEAERFRDKIIVDVRRKLTTDSGRTDENRSVLYVTLLIDAFRNPQILNPGTIRIFDFDDWIWNAFIAQAVDSLRKGKGNIVKLLVRAAPKHDLDRFFAAILFFSGRFRDVLRFPDAPIDLKRCSAICSMKKGNVCTTTIRGDDYIGKLGRSLLNDLCNVVETSKAIRLVKDSIIEMPNYSGKMGVECYLNPPLPGDLEFMPLEKIPIVSIFSPLPLPSLPPPSDSKQPEQEQRETKTQPKNNGTEEASSNVLKNSFQIIRKALIDSLANGTIHLDHEVKNAIAVILSGEDYLRESSFRRGVEESSWNTFFTVLRHIGDGMVVNNPNWIRFLLQFTEFFLKSLYSESSNIEIKE